MQSTNERFFVDDSTIPGKSSPEDHWAQTWENKDFVGQRRIYNKEHPGGVSMAIPWRKLRIPGILLLLVVIVALLIYPLIHGIKVYKVP